MELIPNIELQQIIDTIGDEKVADIHHALRAFHHLSGKELSAIKTLIIHTTTAGFAIDDFIYYVDKIREAQRILKDADYKKQPKKILSRRARNRAKTIAKQKAYKPKHIMKCECGNYMLPSPVNTSPSNQTGDDSKFVFTCPNKDCLEQKFVKDL